MSIVYCIDCGKWIDTDYLPFFTHNNGDFYCEECALNHNFEGEVDGEYAG